MPAYHPRVSVNSICSWSLPFEEDLALWKDIGVDHVGLIEPKLEAFGWDAGFEAIRRSGINVSSFSCYRWGTPASLEFCAELGTGVLYMVTGGYGAIPWEDAAAAFCEELRPSVTRAGELGVTLAVEPTNPLRVDGSFVHSVRDAIDLARACGIGIVVDFYSAWYERDIELLIRKNVDILALVQVCDYKLGTYNTPNRSVLGDCEIPIERLVRTILDAGYDGVFDLELLGPRTEEEGYRSAILRSIEHMSDLLSRLGA